MVTHFHFEFPKQIVQKNLQMTRDIEARQFATAGA